MSEKRFATFEEFWPFYVSEHSKKVTRKLHFVGTTTAMVCAAAGLLGKGKWALLAPLAGYGPAWYSHFFIEKNRPATFKYPLWSLRADFIMWGKTLAGSMDAEVDRVMVNGPVKDVSDVKEEPVPAPRSPDQSLN
jgi:hypothetical protein